MVCEVVLSLYASGASSDEPEHIPPTSVDLGKERNYCNQRHMCIMYVRYDGLRYTSGEFGIINVHFASINGSKVCSFSNF